MRILVIKPSSLGDILHTFPSIALIRENVPDIEYLDWVANDSLAEVVTLCPGVDRVISFPRKSGFSLRALYRFVKELRQREYDIVIDYQGLLRSGLMAACRRNSVRWGFANAREGAALFYDVRYKLTNLSAHALLKNLELTRAVFQLPEGPVPEPKLLIPAEAREHLKTIYQPEKDRPTVAVCFSSRWKSKNWPIDFFAKTLDALQKMQGDFNCVLVGGKDNQEEGERLAALATGARPVNLAGKTTLPELAALLSDAHVLFTVDSGPMHIAAAAGTPCVALFGATTPGLTGPFGPEGFHTIITSQCPKAPCMQKAWPLGKECSEGTSPESVARQIQPYLTTRRMK